LPNFCPDCGNKLSDPNPNFCPNCGNPLTPKTPSNPDISSLSIPVTIDEDEEIKASIAELGNKLEEVVEIILRKQGYETERRKRLRGKSGTLSEIDVVANKSGSLLAVECKNYSTPVGIEKIRDFSQKLMDLGFQGLFVAYNGFTQGASTFAQSQSIETWDHDELSEKLLMTSVGRAGKKGELSTIENALSLNIDFDQASRLDLVNKDNVKIANADLIFHPYFAFEYLYKVRVRDPSDKVHKLEAEDTIFVDGIDGRILNPKPSEGMGLVKKAFRLAVSKEARADNSRINALLDELYENDTVSQYTLSVQDNYAVNDIDPIISISQAVDIAYDYIIDMNTEDIPYSTDDGEELEMTYIPKRRDIMILTREKVSVPRWSINFESFGRNYSREILACSGKVLEDTLIHCPKHFRLGGIISKKSFAVCEICGMNLCKDHAKQCPKCEKWICEDHGTECSSCENRYCKDHINNICPICELPICSACMVNCPICRKNYGKDHTLVCDKCGKKACPDCIEVKGLVRKSRTCRRCVT